MTLYNHSHENCQPEVRSGVSALLHLLYLSTGEMFVPASRCTDQMLQLIAAVSKPQAATAARV
jgi:hypothetical protein